MKKLGVHIFLLLILPPLSGCVLLNHQPGQRDPEARQFIQPQPRGKEHTRPILQETQKKDVVQPVRPEPPEKSVEVIPPEPPKPVQEIPLHKSGKSADNGKPYKSKGVTYYPLLTARGYEERGIASWYGPSFHGRKTSCGVTFDMHKISAAHKLLPMQAKVNVTNLENGKTIALTINDRGPFVPGRVLDLSYAAAKDLGVLKKGLARVLIRTSGPLQGQKKNDIIGEFFVHIGSFEKQEEAAPLLEDMKALKYKRTLLKAIKAGRDGETNWRVELGPYKSMSEANKAHTRVIKDYPSAFVVAKE